MNRFIVNPENPETHLKKHTNPLIRFDRKFSSFIRLRQGWFVYLLALVLQNSSCIHSQKTSLEELEKKDGLTTLMEGNKRFMENHPIHPDQTLERIRNLKKGQHPFAVVVSCSDSRVPPELVFDQGLGDLFVIRNAGNIIGDYELGSVEYAVEHLHTPLVIVLGHTLCGAIGAFIEHKHDSIPNHIQKIVDYIKAEPEEMELREDIPNYYAEAIKANVLHGVHILRESEPVLAELVKNNQVTIVGFIFDLETGKINLVKE